MLFFYLTSGEFKITLSETTSTWHIKNCKFLYWFYTHMLVKHNNLIHTLSYYKDKS